MNVEATSLTIRLPKTLRKRLEKRAAAEHRNTSQFVRYHITRLLDAEKSQPSKKSA